jgi:hypothetical protein
VGALSHYLESEGVPTTQISLIREQTAAIRAPRALWVPFMLGRPLGAPNDPAFQLRVLRRALSLFERQAGPVLEDYDEDAPGLTGEESGFVCPVSFAAPSAGEESVADAMRREIRELQPWHDLAQRRRGRSTVGVFGAPLDDAVRHVESYLQGAPAASPVGDWSPGVAVKRACDDIKAFYYEAVAAQPGNLAPQAIEQWFWSETAAAEALLRIFDYCATTEEPSLKRLRQAGLIPRPVTDGYIKPRYRT